MSGTTSTTIERPSELSTPSEPGKKPWVARLFFSVLQTVLAVVICVALLEMFFRFTGVGEQEIIYPDPVLGCRHIPGKLVTWRFEGYSHDFFSSVGLRDVEHAVVKPEGTVRIALMGDSATEGLQVPLEKTYARLLEKYLNSQNSNPNIKYEVLNFGCSSYSNGQEFAYYKTLAAQYRPDYVIVFYSQGDALENCTNPFFRKNAEPRLYFYFDNNKQLRVDTSVLSMNTDKLHISQLDKFLKTNSRICGVFSQTNLALMLNEKWYQRIRGWTLKGVDIVSGRKDRNALVNKEAEELPSLLGLPPNTDAKIPVYMPQENAAITDAVLNRFGESVRNDGADFVVMTFPSLDKASEYSNQIERLKKFAQNKDFGFLDLTKPFKTSPKVKSLFLAYHFSEDGHDVTARELTKLVLSAESKKSAKLQAEPSQASLESATTR